MQAYFMVINHVQKKIQIRILLIDLSIIFTISCVDCSLNGPKEIMSWAMHILAGHGISHDLGPMVLQSIVDLHCFILNLKIECGNTGLKYRDKTPLRGTKQNNLKLFQLYPGTSFAFKHHHSPIDIQWHHPQIHKVFLYSKHRSKKGH